MTALVLVHARERRASLRRFRSSTIYGAIMEANLKVWSSILREAERELEAATTRPAMDRAAQKLMDAKAQVKQLQAKTAAPIGAKTESFPSA
jgi:hypothetical protein